MTTPNLKYARIERERRFWLEALPPGLDSQSEFTRIRDRYIQGTRLRLRRMETPEGEALDYKLGQKYLSESASQSVMTNLYLDEGEYRQLLKLPGRELVKRRYAYLHGGRRYSVDVFEGPLQGLILCEMEFEDEASADLPGPPFAAREVTAEAFFTGGALAALSPGEFRAWKEANLA